MTFPLLRRRCRNRTAWRSDHDRRPSGPSRNPAWPPSRGNSASSQGERSDGLRGKRRGRDERVVDRVDQETRPPDPPPGSARCWSASSSRARPRTRRAAPSRARSYSRSVRARNAAVHVEAPVVEMRLRLDLRPERAQELGRVERSARARGRARGRTRRDRTGWRWRRRRRPDVGASCSPLAQPLERHVASERHADQSEAQRGLPLERAGRRSSPDPRSRRNGRGAAPGSARRCTSESSGRRRAGRARSVSRRRPET